MELKKGKKSHWHPPSSPIITPKWLRRPVCFNLIRAPAAINKLRTQRGVRGTEEEGGNCCATVRTYLKHCEAKVENGSTQSKCLRLYSCVIKHGKRVGAIIEGTHTPLNHPWLFMVGALLTRMVVVVEGLGARGWGWWNHTPSRVLSCLCLSDIGCCKKRRRKKETFFSPLSLRVQPTSSLIGCLSVHVCFIIGAALQFGHTNMRIPSH